MMKNKSIACTLTLISALFLMMTGCGKSKPQAQVYTEKAAETAHVLKTTPTTPIKSTPEQEISTPPYDNEETMSTRFFNIKKSTPKHGAVDEELSIDIEITARSDVREVVVKDIFNTDINIVRTSPPAETYSNNNEVVWKFDSLNKNDSKFMKVWVSSDTSGDLIDNVTVSALPCVSTSTFIGKSDLKIQGKGPELLCLQKKGLYNVTICNKGSAIARDVIATCVIPRGMDSANGDSEISWRLGNIKEDGKETISFSLEAIEAGNQNIVVKAVASNHDEVVESLNTAIVQPRFNLSCSAAKEQFVGKDAEAAFTITNTCTLDLKDVVITDSIYPKETTTITNASDGEVLDNQVIWKIETLKAGHSHVCHVSAASEVLGEMKHRIHATGSNKITTTPCEANGECTTLIKGHPGLLIEMIDTCDPMIVGEVGTYRIRVTNQGTASDDDVQIIAILPEELEPVSSQGSTEGRIESQKIIFAPHMTLNPNKSIEYAFEAKAKSKGDARVKVELHSKLLATPVIEEESTYIY